MKKILFFLTLFLLSAGMSWAQNVIFVKSGVTDGESITVNGVSGAAYNTPRQAVEHAQFGDTVRLTEDVTAESYTYYADGAAAENPRKCCVVCDRIVIDGAGHFLTPADEGAISAIIYTHGGTIMNLTIKGRTPRQSGLKGIIAEEYGGTVRLYADLILDNVTFENVDYTLNVQGEVNNNNSVIIRNSHLNGQTSYANLLKSYTVINSEFGQGYEGKTRFKPYGAAIVQGCTFTDCPVNLSSCNGNAVLFNGCTINSTPLSSDNLDNLLETGVDNKPKAVVTNSGYSANSDGEITGGIYGGSLTSLNSLCAEGYKGFPLGTDPETYRVTPVYYIHFNAGSGTGTMESVYVPREAPKNVYTVPACTFTNGEWSFAEWNTQADGQGARVKPGDELTLTDDVTLYAQWAKVFNTNSGNGYDDLQTAIDAATAGDSLVVLADLNVNAVISVTKNLIINGGKHNINTTATRGLWTDASGVNLTLRNFNLNGGTATNRGIQVNDPNVTIVMDSCNIIMQGSNYAILATEYDLGHNPNENLHMTVTNSYIKGLTALRSFAPEANFTFVNDTLHGVNPYNDCPSSGNNFAVIMLCGDAKYGDGHGSENTNISFENCVIIAEEQGTCSEEWIGFVDGTTNASGIVDANTKILDGNENDITEEVNMSDGGPNNRITMPLTATQVEEFVNDPYITVTDNGNGTYTISTNVYYDWTTGGVYCDFHSPFKEGWLADDETINLLENVTMTENLTPGIVKFKLKFNGKTITKGDYCIMLEDGDTVITDAQTDIFCADGGRVVETDNGDGTYTYAITPYVAMNVNTGTGYTNLQSAVDAVNNGDTIRILRNINLTSMVNVNASVVNNFTIDLNGDTISFSGSGSNDAAIRILNGAELTIKDNGTNGAIINPGMGSAVLGAYGTLVLESGTLEGKGSQTNALYLWATGATTMGSAIINGGTLKSASGMAVRHRGDMLTINDGTFISGNNNVIQNQSNAEINGGTFTPGATYRYAIYNTGTMTINDATTNGTGGSLSNSGKMTVNDGVFHSIGGNAAYNSGADTLTINSGDFYVSATNGFRNTNNAGTFLFNGGTVTDHGVTQSVIYNTGKFVMTGVEISASAADYTVWIDANGIFEAHNGKIENTNADQSALIYCDDGDAQITIDGTQLIGTANNTYGIWEVGPNVNITMTSGSINTTKYCIVNNGTNTTTTSKWVISGGTLTSETTAIYHAAPDSVIIGIDCDNGPTITGVNAAIEHRAGHLVIKGGTLTATGTPYSCTANASGTTTVGAAVAVAQHTTNVETTMDISCGTFEGESSISIANPQGNTGDNVDASITGGLFTGEVVTSDTRIDDYITGGTFDDATVIGELTNRIEPGYYPFDNGDGTTTVGRYSVVYHDNSTDDLQYAVMLPQNEEFPTTITITMPTTFTPVANSVVAWNTKADGSGAWYTEGSTVEIDSYLDLYAHWVAVYNATQDIYYTTLQGAIDAATANDSLVILTDMTIGAITGKSTSIEIVKSLTINGLKHTITSTAGRGLWVNASNVTLTLRNFYLTCTNTSDDTRGVQINASDNSEIWINNTLLMDSCRVITVTGKTLNFVGDQGSGPVSVTVTNSYIKGWAAMQCFASNSTFTFDNDTLYGINTKSYAFGTIVIDGNNDTTKYGKNNNINITQSVIIAEKQSSALQHVFRLQNKATHNNIVVDCQTKIVNGIGTGAQDIREELFIGDQNCPYNSIILPLTDEQKAIIASDAAGRRFGLTDTGDDVCGTMTMTKVSRQARNSRCAQDIGFHLYFDTEHYANHVIAGGSAKLTLIEDVVLQKDETVDVNGRFLLFFKDWYNSNITHNIINNGHHIILAEGTSCGTDVEVPDSIFAVPAGFDGKIVHKSVSGQVHKFEYYAAPYVAINVNRDIKYISLQTAVDSVNTGDTVRLLRNITYSTTSDRVIITDKNLTLDLYGDTISTSFSSSTAGQYAAIQLKSGYLEVKDTKGEGVIRATNRGSAVLVGTSTSAGGNASFTLNSGKLEGTATSNTWGLYVVLNEDDSVVLNGGEVAATGAGPALYNKQGKVIVNDGRIQGNGKAVYNYYAYNNTYFPTTILNGGEIHGGNTSYPCVDNAGGTFIMNNGTITIAGMTGISSGTSYGRNGELYINGGVISDEGLTTNTINTIAGSKGKIIITGGTFNLSNDNANVININGQDTVTVTGGTIAATGANDIIFKGAGNGAVFTISDATLNAAAMFNLGSGDSCVVSGGKFTATDDLFTNAGKLTLNGGVFTQSSDNAITNTGTFTVNDGWYSESLTRLTRGTPRWLNGDDISYYGTPELHLIKVADDAVAAAGLTGNYWQLGNTITYDANGGTGSESQDKPMNETVNLSDGTGFSYEGHTLYRWNTQADGNGTDYALGAPYSADANLDLFAVWRLNLDMEMDSTDVVCYGENNGTDTVKIIGGDTPFQLVLSGTVLAENDTVKNLMDRTYIYKNLKPGKYTVQLTDVLTKDTIKGTFTIAQPDTLIVETMTVPVKPCPLMGTGVYNVSMTTTGGNGDNHFVWGEAAVDVDAMESTVISGADDRDSTYTVAVKVTDKKGCVATDTTTFKVSPVIADDGTVHSNSKLTIDTIKQGIMSGCDTVIREFGTPHFTSTHPEINEGILDTIYNDIPTSYPDSVFSLGENVVIWTAVDTCGHMITGEQIIIIYHYPCPDVEMDGYTYHSVRLACDCWTDENLKTTKYSDGRAVNNLMKYESPTHPDADANFAIYGYLYDWTAALDAESGVTPDAEGNVQGICPTGWHLPSDIEFANVAGLNGTNEISDLRYHGYWLDGGGNNSTNFSLLPGGCYNDNTARYENLLGNAYLWSVNSADPNQPKVFWADCHCYMWQVGNPSANMGCSVRCVKD